MRQAASLTLLLAATIGTPMVIGAQAPLTGDSTLTTRQCLACHAMPNLAWRDTSGAVRHFTIAADSFASSAHGKLECRQCHADVATYPHDIAARHKVSCDDDCHATSADGSPYTHAPVLRDFRTSAHAAGLTDPSSDSPNCQTCHGTDAHVMAPEDGSRTAREKIALCTSCHDDREKTDRNHVDPDAVTSYRRSFHYKAILFGGTNTATCQDCHTAHHALPPDSAESSVGPMHVAETCGQSACHEGARLNFAMSGANHLTLRIDREPLLRFMEEFFLVLTAGTMLLLVAGIVLDVQKTFNWVTVFRRLGRRAIRLVTSLGPPLAAMGRFARAVLID